MNENCNMWTVGEGDSLSIVQNLDIGALQVNYKCTLNFCFNETLFLGMYYGIPKEPCALEKVT